MCLCCKGACTPAEWKCASGECLLENQRCDGIRQCADGSDENQCGNYIWQLLSAMIIIIKWPFHCSCSFTTASHYTEEKMIRATKSYDHGLLTEYYIYLIYYWFDAEVVSTQCVLCVVSTYYLYISSILLLQ